MKILLIVDDEVFIADGLQTVLAEAFEGQLEVLCCYSAARALEIARSRPLDILMTDINMPDCSGLELHQKLQALQPDCRVIYLTGYSDFEYARQALDLHAFVYILKCEGDDYVIQTIRRLLETDAPEPPPQTPEDERPSPDWLEKLHAYIDGHLAEDLSLNRLADCCHFHPVYLSRAYKDAQGVTISNYIGQAKQEKAEQLLRDSSCSILEISRMTGFATDNYFCRWFRKRTGLTPQAYRSRSRRK